MQYNLHISKKSNTFALKIKNILCLTIKNLKIMTTKEFFNLPLGINFTTIELYNIEDALFIAADYYKEKKLKGTAYEYETISKKISTFLKENVDIHF